jgi:hypothetical protein
MMGGKSVRLEEVPLDSQVHIVAARDSQGVPRATRIEVLSAPSTPPAVTPPGSLVRGTIVGVHPPSNSIIVRTLSGDMRIPLAAAPVIANGRPANSRALRLGDAVEVQREILTPGGSEYITKVVTVTGRAAAASGTVTSVIQTTTRRGRAISRSRTTRRVGASAASKARRTSLTRARMKRAGYRSSYSARRVRAARVAMHGRRSRTHRTTYRTRRTRGTNATTRIETTITPGAPITAVTPSVPTYRPATPAQNPAGYQAQPVRSRPR